MLRNSLHDRHIGKRGDPLRRRPSFLHPHQQRLARMFIDQVQRTRHAAVMCAHADEVIAPYMVGMRRPQPHTRSVVEPQTTARLLLLWHLQALTSPDPLHAVPAHLPTCSNQKRRDAAIAITAVLAGQCDDRLRQLVFIRPLRRPIALRAAWLLRQTARSPLTQTMPLLCMLRGLTSTLRA